MRDIEVKVLNPAAITDAEKMMVCAARLTQSGHKISNLDDFMALYNRDFSAGTVERMVKLPHPTIQKFGAVNVIVVGASRRFLAQITRHQNEVKFMSASLQYSNYAGQAHFAIPYRLLEYPEPVTDAYIKDCQSTMDVYEEVIENGLDHDSAGYLAPQGLRNVLLISATPYQWKHMIGQRTCRRNTDETRIVMLKIWQELWSIAPQLFSINTTGAFCLREHCAEGKFSCGCLIGKIDCPEDLLRRDYPLLFKEAEK